MKHEAYSSLLIPHSSFLKKPRQDGHGAAGLRLLLLPSGPGRVGRRLLAWFLAGTRIRYNDYREMTRGSPDKEALTPKTKEQRAGSREQRITLQTIFSFHWKNAGFVVCTDTGFININQTKKEYLIEKKP